MKSTFEPAHSAHRHISWSPDRIFGAFLPKSFHSWDLKKWLFFCTSSNRAEIKMERCWQDVYHCHECLDQNRRHFFEIRYRCKKVKNKFPISWLTLIVQRNIRTIISSIPLDFDIRRDCFWNALLIWQKNLMISSSLLCH